MTNKVPPIFKDASLQKTLEEDGFVKITLLGPDDVEKLVSLFQQHYPKPSADFYSSSYDNDFVEKKKMSDEIGTIICPRLETIFENYRWFGSAFLSKGDGPRSEMPMHQDWTIVDETQFVALNIWTPLQNTTQQNGTLEVIKGSHRWHKSLRAPTLPFYYHGYQNKLREKLEAIPTLAGEAIVLNQSIIHASKANHSGQMRMAITTGIKTQRAPMIFHYWNKETPNRIEQFEQEDDFLIRFENFHESIFKRPVLGKSLGYREFTLPVLSPLEIEKLKGQDSEKNAGAKKGFAQKIRQWITGS